MDQHRAVLGLPPRGSPLTSADVQRAFRQRALTAHPDKPTGSAIEFRKVAAARDAILKTLSAGGATHFDCASPTTRPRASTAAWNPGRSGGRTAGGGAPAAPKPFSVPPAQSFVAMLAGGALYTFDISPGAFGGSGLRNGDPVKRFGPKDGSDGTAGVVVGVSSGGMIYWWKKGSATASSFAPAAGEAGMRWVRVKTSQAPVHVDNSKPAPSSNPSARKSSAMPPATNSVPHGGGSAPSTGASTSSTVEQPSIGLALRNLQRRELDARSAIGAAATAYFAQAEWALRLALYAPHDRQYNTAFFVNS